MCDVVTGDETYIYYRKIEDSRSWVEEGEGLSTAVRRMPTKKYVLCIFDDHWPGTYLSGA